MSNNDNTADPGDNSQNNSTVKTPENLKEIDEIKQTLKRKFDEVSEKLQSIEASISKIPKIENDKKSAESTENEADSTKNSANSIESTIPEAEVLKSEKRLVLKHVFKNVESISEGEYNTSDFENHFNVDSRIVLKRSNDYLGCFVHMSSLNNKTEWSVEAKLDFKIDGKLKKSEMKGSSRSYKQDDSWGFPRFLKWEEIKNEYLIDGSLTVEALVQIIETSGFSKEKVRTFDESTEEHSDVVLVVNKKEFYVLRKFLAAQSSFFKALLLGNFAESLKSKVTLTGIDPTDFHYFLEVLYGELAIDEYNVEGILLLADMYDAKTATRRCENFLLKESEKSLKKKLQMAARYRLENLKYNCMEKIKTNEDVRNVLPANINDLDHEVMGELLKKSISFR